MDTPSLASSTPTVQGRAERQLTIIYTMTIFLSAGLLFMIQPLFARMALPLLGGAPAVWTTAMVSYQALLLLGYAYSHLSVRLLGIRRQALLHLIVLLLPLVALPLGIPAGWKPPTTTNAIPWLVMVLLVTVGLPFFALSTSSPLLQRWFASTGHAQAHNPYFLYAASNVGSMIGLFSYPLLAEPLLPLRQQRWLWTAGYALLLLMMALCVRLVYVRAPKVAERGQPTAPPLPLPAGRILRWIVLASLPSSLMLGVTTYISTELGPLPLLWALPLGLYLLTYSLVFASKPPISHERMRTLMPYLLLPVVICTAVNIRQPFWAIMLLHLLAFFVITMVCHGALAADRPAAAQLTSFYLWLSVGGVAGGLFNGLLAPVIFDAVYEYPLALFAAALALPASAKMRRGRPVHRGQARLLDILIPGALIVVIGVMGWLMHTLAITPLLSVVIGFGLPALVCLRFVRRPLRFGLSIGALMLAGMLFVGGSGRSVVAERSFFGIHRVLLMQENGKQYHGLIHGNTLHGLQSLTPGEQRAQIFYYTKEGPAGQIFAALGSKRAHAPIAVTGLGSGSMACYAAPEQEWTYYEIDPVVVQLARDPRYFSFLSTCAPQATVIVGDARLTLAEAPDHHYGAIFQDAYTSDSLPLHLLTREALGLYLSKLDDQGLLIFHITNRHFDLEPVLASLAEDLGLQARIIEYSTAQNEYTIFQGNHTLLRWVVMARKLGDLGPLATNQAWRPLHVPDKPLIWTDEHHSLMNVLRSF